MQKRNISPAKERLSNRQLAARFGVPERTLNTILTTAKLDPTGGFDVEEAERAAIAHYREEAKRADNDAARDRARKNKAEADEAEIKTAKLRRRMIMRDDYLNNYADAIAQGVSAISKLKSLTPSQKEEVFAAIRSVKLPDLEDE